MVHLFEIWRKVNSRYATDITSETKRICEAYADGINAYIEHNKDIIEQYVYPLNG